MNIITSSLSLLGRLEVIFNTLLLKKTTIDLFHIRVISIWLEVFVIFTIPIICVIALEIEGIGALVFNGKYDTILYFLPFGLSFLFISHVAYLFSPYIYVEKRVELWSKASFYSAVTYFFSLIVLVEIFGAIGAVLAFICCKLVYSLYLIKSCGWMFSVGGTIVSTFFVLISCFFMAYFFDKYEVTSLGTLLVKLILLYVAIILPILYLRRKIFHEISRLYRGLQSYRPS